MDLGSIIRRAKNDINGQHPSNRWIPAIRETPALSSCVSGGPSLSPQPLADRLALKSSLMLWLASLDLFPFVPTIGILCFYVLAVCASLPPLQ